MTGGSGPVLAVFGDGGVIQVNPSPLGGTFAWCHVGEGDLRLAHGSGVIQAGEYGLATISNNVTEFLALVAGLEALPAGWSGRVCSDSKITLGRLCWGWKMTGLPLPLIKRGAGALARLGSLTPVLHDGHPTQAQLRTGRGKRGNPVSHHNVFCDRECGRLAVFGGRQGLVGA